MMVRIPGTSKVKGIEGSWAPTEEVDPRLPIYARMANRAEQNQQWVQQNCSDQAAESARLNKNLMKSIGEISKSYDRYNQSWWVAQKLHDYTSWAWSQPTLGQGTWVSEREGAAVERNIRAIPGLDRSIPPQPAP